MIAKKVLIQNATMQDVIVEDAEDRVVKDALTQDGAVQDVVAEVEVEGRSSALLR